MTAIAINANRHVPDGFAHRLRDADFAQFRMFALVAIALLMLVVTFWPNFAYAGFLDDLVEDLVGTLLAPVIHAISQAIDGLYQSLFDVDSIVNDLKNGTAWTDLLGTGESGLYGAISTIQDSVILPIAMQILTLSMMFRLFTLSKIAESQDMMPLFPKIAITMVGYFFASYLVQNAAAIVTVGYDMIQHMVSGIAAVDATEINWVISEEVVKENNEGIVGAALLFVFFALVQLVFCAITWVVAVVLYYGKVILLYIQALFSPIPLALVGIDQTRSWALGFIKNLASTLLGLVIVYLLLSLFPLIMQSVISAGGWGVQGSVGETIWAALAGTDANWLSIVLASIAINVLMVFMLVKSGGIAKEVLGS